MQTSASRIRTAWGLALVCILYLAVPGQADVQVPGDHHIKNIDFEQHVMGLFGRMGCNAGSCHGSFQGKGGLRLSLFGYNPEMDYTAMTREVMGRRLNVTSPEQSLLLLKATGQVEHGGGVRFQKGSWQYQIFLEWIQNGARWQEGSGDVKRIVINPPELSFKKRGEVQQLQIIAEFKDGTKSNITPFCDFRTNDDAVAEADTLGKIKSLAPGSTAIIVKYRGHVLPVNVLVPGELPRGTQFPKLAANNYIDEIVFARLKKLNMIPSKMSSDPEFLRRVYIDTIGRIPTPKEVRDFLNDKRSDKRARLIDRLLDDPMHAALWATKYCDITGNDTLSLEQPTNLRVKRSQMWHDWFAKRFEENMPYDEIVRGVLTATSREGRSVKQWINDEYQFLKDLDKTHDYKEYTERDSLDMFWRFRQRVPVEQWGEKTAAAFMGVRLECAQCHKHPFDRWTQEEYRAYANVFTQVAFGTSTEARKEITALNKKLIGNNRKNRNKRPQIREVYILPRPTRGLNDPTTNKLLPPRALGGPELEVKQGEDLRVALFEWLRKPENPFFSRSFVNRVWGHYTGVGIVNPVDDFSLANPPSNPELLDALAADFAKHKYDIRYIERMVLNSKVYQLSSSTNETNKLDRNNYAHAYVRPMMAEVVVDVLNGALGVEENFGKDMRPGIKAIQVGPSTINSRQIDYAFRIFGRPPRTSNCDCERAMDPALPQKLYLMTDSILLRKINGKGSRLLELLASKKSDSEVLEELFLATLSRYPSQAEIDRFAKYQKTVEDRRAAFTDCLWALVNTREFILNH